MTLIACSGCIAACTAVIYIAGVAVPIVTLTCRKLTRRKK